MLTRRTFTQLLAAGAGAQTGARRPNIVMIYADDLGYGDLGCYGHPVHRTPNLDRMAGEGARFTQFYSAAPVCTPSRAALLTGRLPMRSGLTRVLFPHSTGGIPESETTMAEVLKGAGYRTACVGKWHLGHLPQYLPVRHGFDSYFGIPYSNDMRPLPGPGAPGDKKYPSVPLVRDEKVVEEEPDQTKLTARYTAEAVRFIRQSGENPFFLYFPHTFPHVPLYASERFRGKSRGGLYGDVVEEIDWSVGEVLRSVSEMGQDRNTLVLFSSDNGPWLVKRELGGSAGLLREGKATTWDGGMREPFLARWPGMIPAGSVNHAFATTMDLLPTFTKLGGGQLPQGVELDGEDISAVLTGKGPGRERAFFYWRHEDLCAVRKGKWKLHVFTIEAATAPQKNTKLETPQLYDVETDPSERFDVAPANPDVVRELAAMLEQHRVGMKPGVVQK
jgi:arylsulfatase